MLASKGRRVVTVVMRSQCVRGFKSQCFSPVKTQRLNSSTTDGPQRGFIKATTILVKYFTNNEW